MKKNFAEFRFAEQKVIPFPRIDSVTGGGSEYSALQVPSLGLSCKRFLDVTFTLCVLIFGFPFYLLIAVLIKLTSEGPVLFIQERAGKDEKPFYLYKFRTMTVGNNDDANPLPRLDRSQHDDRASDRLVIRMRSDNQEIERSLFLLQRGNRFAARLGKRNGLKPNNFVCTDRIINPQDHEDQGDDELFHSEIHDSHSNW